VVAKTVEGEIGFMTGHEPVLAILAEGQVRITQSDGTKVLANAQDGFLSMEGDVLTIVAGNAALIA
jgi:F-type H+-transporting ATPase subunit epsilon